MCPQKAISNNMFGFVVGMFRYIPIHVQIHCDVNVSIKPVTQKAKGHLEEVFDVEPSKLTIPSHSHLYVSTSFKPTAMQVSNGITQTYWYNTSTIKMVYFCFSATQRYLRRQLMAPLSPKERV